MAALARLCALGHLDLDLVRTDQVTAGHAETAGSHLFDGGTAVRAVRFPWNPDGRQLSPPSPVFDFP